MTRLNKCKFSNSRVFSKTKQKVLHKLSLTKGPNHITLNWHQIGRAHV